MRGGPKQNRAFSLVELTLALGVSAFCLIAICGLLPVGIKSHQTAIEQTAANGILSAVAADLRATPQQVSASQQFSVAIPANPVTSATSATALYFTSEGKSSTSLTPDSRYLLTITFLPNGSHLRTATLAKLQVSWPATMPPDHASGSAQTFLAVDRN